MNPQDKESILRDIAKVLARFEEIDPAKAGEIPPCGIELGYVYGSFLEREDFRDIDIALYLSEKVSDPYDQLKFAMKVGRELERAITPRYEFDVRILGISPITFQHEVLKKGKPVYCRDEAKRIRYEAQVLSEYLDYREVLEWFDEKFISRWGHGG